MINKLLQQSVLFLVFILSLTNVHATEVSDSIEALLENNRNVEGEFRQVTYDEQGKELQVSEGVFLLAKPNQFVWDSISPFSQRIISNGQTVTIWDVDLEQATQRPVSGSVGNSPAALLSQPARDVLPNFDVSEISNGKYRLAPKDDQTLFQTLTLSFKKDLISAMSIVDSLGQTTVIEFKNVETHEGVAKANFTLELPEHVDVIIEGN
ncbi:outer membrane lipoprotein chaperone LolA [Marinomonas sp. C2222]|uniref:Outer-membrane lipoprotein carrier protein n=1 Tax=Marinomonas sargassi TaxID=2984494 RepID=A0ABT2YN48_9GAMM|nr:outer membrane lipoprotein chaperone LolA [Marinomonas sargassi]MCV2401304.1 outer membrane lipoprotein chaperone LolA [Marinomonas sargassi]